MRSPKVPNHEILGAQCISLYEKSVFFQSPKGKMAPRHFYSTALTRAITWVLTKNEDENWWKWKSTIKYANLTTIYNSRKLRCSLIKVKPWSQGWFIAAGAYPGFCSMKWLGVFLLPLEGMPVHHRSIPWNFVRFPQQIGSTHLYIWVERGTVRIKCLSQEHNTMSPVRVWTWTARSRVERTNLEATAPPATESKV